MTVSLFNNQLILEVPDDVNYICFRRQPEVIAFCLTFSFERMHVLTDRDSLYVTLNTENTKWYTTTEITNTDYDHYDATDALLQLIRQQEPQAYEYW